MQVPGMPHYRGDEAVSQRFALFNSLLLWRFCRSYRFSGGQGGSNTRRFLGNSKLWVQIEAFVGLSTAGRV